MLIRKEIQVAIVAPQRYPVGESGGAEIFTGTLANGLEKHGFQVTVFGLNGPTYPFRPGVNYIETGPTADDIHRMDGVSLRRAVFENGVNTSLILAKYIDDTLEDDPNQMMVFIDNDLATAPLAPSLTKNEIPHILIRHNTMTQHSYGIYQSLVKGGARLIAIADHQREEVARNFGDIYDTTIKNGISLEDPDITPRTLRPGEEIQIGTLCRVEGRDLKGIRFAAEAVAKVNEQYSARLVVAGPIADRGYYDAQIAPLVEKGIAVYVGPKNVKEKPRYLSSLHAGVQLSNPGNWDSQTETFTGQWKEGHSLTLSEMIFSGALPVSSDSGGAEPMTDAGLEEFIVPLHVLREEGADAFTTLAAKKMIQAAYAPASVKIAAKQRVRTADLMAADYGKYMANLLEGYRSGLMRLMFPKHSTRRY